MEPRHRLVDGKSEYEHWNAVPRIEKMKFTREHYSNMWDEDRCQCTETDKTCLLDDAQWYWDDIDHEILQWERAEKNGYWYLLDRWSSAKRVSDAIHRERIFADQDRITYSQCGCGCMSKDFHNEISLAEFHWEEYTYWEDFKRAEPLEEWSLRQARHDPDGWGEYLAMFPDDRWSLEPQADGRNIWIYDWKDAGLESRKIGTTIGISKVTDDLVRRKRIKLEKIR